MSVLMSFPKISFDYVNLFFNVRFIKVYFLCNSTVSWILINFYNHITTNTINYRKFLSTPNFLNALL